jgi:hypothetical protein
MKPGRSSQWGSPRAFAEWAIALAVLAILVNTHSSWLNSTLRVLMLGIVVLGSCIVLWHMWQHRGKPGPPPLGQDAALPPKWRKWVLGEMEDEKRDGGER